MNLFINTEDANSTKIWLPLKYVFLYGNLRAYYLSNGLFFFERCSLITATVCAYKLNNARFEKEQSTAYIYILKTFPTLHFNFL